MEKWIQSMCYEFETHMKKQVHDYGTSVAPGSNLLAIEDEAIYTGGHRKLVGKTLLAVKKVLPDAGNVVQDLLMPLVNPGNQQWKAVARVMGHFKYHDEPIKLR